MPRPIAVVSQEFANAGVAAVVAPTQGLCLLGKCIVEADATLPGYDAGELTVAYSALTPEAFSPVGA